MVRVSVVMATYNGELYIKEQILSIVNQTKPPSEIIIVDDASTDNTVNLILELTKSIRIEIKLFVNKENMGVCKTFNKALLECSGDLIFLADQDDFWYENKIEKMEDIMISDKTLGCCICNVDLSDGNLNMLGLTMNESVIRRGRRINDRVMGAASCYRSSLIDFAMPIPDTVHSHDKWLSTIANYLNCKKMIYTSYQKYRLHDSNVVGDRNALIEPAGLVQKLKRKIQKFDSLEINKNLKRDLNILYEINQLFLSKPKLNNSPYLPSIERALLEVSNQMLIVKSRIFFHKISLFKRIIRIIELRLKHGKLYAWTKILQDLFVRATDGISA